MVNRIGKEPTISYLNTCNGIMVARSVSTHHHLPRYARIRWSVLCLGPQQPFPQYQQGIPHPQQTWKHRCWEHHLHWSSPWISDDVHCGGTHLIAYLVKSQLPLTTIVRSEFSWQDSEETHGTTVFKVTTCCATTPTNTPFHFHYYEALQLNLDNCVNWGKNICQKTLSSIMCTPEISYGY